MSFEENIRNWITIDNQIKQYNANIKSLREKKTHLSDSIIAHAVDQNLSHNTVEITDGTLKFQNIKVTAPLNFKFMKKCLNECIADEEQVKLLITYIKQKREVKYVPEIKRTYTK
jgi:flagellar basal body rod protein FlgB